MKLRISSDISCEGSTQHWIRAAAGEPWFMTTSGTARTAPGTDRDSDAAAGNSWPIPAVFRVNDSASPPGASDPAVGLPQGRSAARGALRPGWETGLTTLLYSCNSAPQRPTAAPDVRARPDPPSGRSLRDPSRQSPSRPMRCIRVGSHPSRPDGQNRRRCGRTFRPGSGPAPMDSESC
jgi:hypothetical protein